MKRLKLD